jgi:CRISPR-associated endonuclease/helicase Cas3
MAIGHTKNADGVRHDLVVHLRAVADLASQFSAALAAPAAGRYLGLWHDVGKFHPLFQDYLLHAEAGDMGRSGRVDHKAAGAKLARDSLGAPFSMVIAGHHGGLPSRSEWEAWLRDRLATGQPDEALELARRAMEDLDPRNRISLPASVEGAKSPLDVELFLRLMFSALVDADSLDTERHFSTDHPDLRGRPVSLDELWPAYEQSQRRLLNSGREGVVTTQRRIVYEAALAAAGQPAGLFRLTVPTGGGKTRSGLGFALRHALANGQSRIIVALPFLTITDQTTDVFRSIFDTDGREGHVLEDHSGVVREDDEDVNVAAVRARLAAENWDAPIVVTTTVQLFESLFANTRSRCRKLHRLANSVIVLDEAQALPAGMLRPILDALRDLAVNFNTSVVVSTATQPSFQEIPEFARVPATEIVPDVRDLFATLRRASYRWELSTPAPWSAVAERIRAERQVLAIVNTKRDAKTLLNELRDPDALHLSTALCGAHRRAVLAEVRRRLSRGQPCRLVSTQVVEAGVDIDFPVVYRAVAPLGSVIQAAGRCNREGTLATGQVIVFDPEGGGLPGGVDYRVGTDQTRALVRSLGADAVDVDDPALATAFFRAVYQLVDTDRTQVQVARAILDYPEVARRFQMIEPSASVVVAYPGDTTGTADRLASRLKDPRSNARRTLRALQPYLVSMPYHAFDRYSSDGLIEQLMPGVGRWLGRYDPVRGLSDTPALGEVLVV